MMLSTQKIYARPNDLEFVLGIINEIERESPDFSKNTFAYGGYVRDKLRGKPFQDMDISVPCLKVATQFIERLENSQRMISLIKKSAVISNLPSVDYQCFSLVIQTPKNPALNIDISYSHSTLLRENSLDCCDFTANNLKMDKDGNVSTRIKAWEIGKAEEFSESDWNAKCIRDCMEGKLVWMIPARYLKGFSASARNTFMEKMNMRHDKMISKGFVDTDEYLTSFRLLKLRPVSELSAERDASICTICHENYCDTADQATVVAQCSHHFHKDCMQKWIDKKTQESQEREPKCPCCRKEIVLYY